MADKAMPTIGIIGAGRLGTAIAKQALRAGYSVKIANSRGPESLTLQLSVLLPGAEAATTQEVILRSDIVVLAIPLNKYKSLQPELFVGKTVIDAMNYWAPTEGTIAEFSKVGVSSSEYIQKYLKDAKVIKTLNHVAYHELEEHSLPPFHPGRRAVILAGDDVESKRQAARLVSDMGFDTVDVGGLDRGTKFQPDTQLFNARYDADFVRELILK